MTRPLTLCDLDFTDLRSDDDKDDLMPRNIILNTFPLFSFEMH